MARLSDLARALALVALPCLSIGAVLTVDPIPGRHDSLPPTGSMPEIGMSAIQSTITSTTFITMISVSSSSSYPLPTEQSGSIPPYPIPVNATEIGSDPTTTGAPLPLCSGPPPTYTVAHLDTVEKIAAKFNITTDALEAANPGRVLFWDLMEESMELVIPPAACSPSGAPGDFATATSRPPVASTSITSLYNSSDQSSSQPTTAGPVTAWTVASGDSGSVIASKANVLFIAISSANPSVTWTALSVGQTLVIPPPPTVTSSPPLISNPMTSLSNSSAQSTSQPTPTGPVTAWTVASRDSGGIIASKANVPFFAISSANPSVTWTSLSVGQTLVIPPSPTALAQVTGSLAVTSFDSNDGKGPPEVMYTEYNGDGSSAQGWPAMSDWLSFNAQWNIIATSIGQRCGDGVPLNIVTETNDLKVAILTVASETYIDPRFVLATVMQESNGCVRVQTTSLANPNPGVLQSYNGNGTCNHNGTFDTPCPPSMIHRMIMDGVAAPIDGVTIVSALNQAVAEVDGVEAEPAQAYYRAARFYNSGPASLPPETDGDLGSNITAATRCYASDIANRLRGWSNGGAGRSPCTLDAKD
ncbi:hypothetical protein A1O7_04781 [Cladophialophora yegresii CBS 114405]|uniref:LysM domain-containing protein n=1 Tax=Cladophialophora yegresii CBS 114405 TaxID=1182544 RepID=W9VY71_9EURO|nr:uncharacterized protein A1O7_04781 [Cladophialophora yegresii CBS 114405]EXJ60628.1 hypothetical protein A1O7_04781 [Cladophialophora yegresii CBS 114405]